MLPGLYAWLWKVRHGQSAKALQESVIPEEYYKDARIIRAVVGGGELAVQGGPFAGMRYVSQPGGSAFYPKLIGCYEEELHGVLESTLSSAHALVVNVGCGEGYYAVGLALRLPRARVHAFDIGQRSRRLCAEMAHLNGVAGRVKIAGLCTPERLRRITRKPALVVCDCEGCELELIDPDLVPGLRACTLLVELHDFIDGQISRTIISRFAPTHDITLVKSVARDPSAFPALDALNPDERLLAVAEGRPETMQWAYMTPI